MSVVTVKRPPAPAPLDLVEAFINTADLETGSDEFATSGDLRAWFVGHGLLNKSGLVSEGDRRRVIKLREALRRAALANNRAAVDSGTIRELNHLARDARMVVSFADDGGARLDPSANGVDAGVARVLAAVFIAMMTGRWERLKSCGNDACHWAFYDASKNRSGRWCEMADCGNEAKGRTYRARRRAAAGPRGGER